MIVLVTDSKWGKGKTTLAVNLAVLRTKSGRKVALVDTDHRGHAISWATLRAIDTIQPKVTCISVGVHNAKAELLRLVPFYDDIVIDGSGNKAAMLTRHLADVIVTPALPQNPTIRQSALTGKAVTEIAPLNIEAVDAVLRQYKEVFDNK